MNRLPRSTPWGKKEHCTQIAKGVFCVFSYNQDDKKDLGGIMIRKDSANFLSDYARKIAIKHGNYLCFSEGRNTKIIYRELLDKKMWEVPRYMDYAKTIEDINRNVQDNHPEYWEQRQKRPPLSERLKTGTDKAAITNANVGLERTEAKQTDKTEMR